MPDGIILVDKPSGITSFDVIRRLRKTFGKKKMGHAGTLDPLATGLMIIAVDGATKTLTQYLKLPKSYRAHVRFGISTDTLDTDGKIVERLPVPEFTIEDINHELSHMAGDIELSVPMYSAIKKEGKPLYVYARSGEEILVPKKIMHITSAVCESYQDHEAVIVFSVLSGTYIRSLVVELAQRLGTLGTVSALRRLSIGEFSVESPDVITV